MTGKPLDHVGIAVRSIDEALPTWEDIVGAKASARERVESQGVEVVFVGEGEGRVELLAPIRDDSPIARFLEKRGPGMHHLCYRVPDIADAIADFAARGYQLIDQQGRPGAAGHTVAFLHPRTTAGVLIELLETD